MTADSIAVPLQELARAVQVALSEDMPSGDATTDRLFPTAIPAIGIIRAKQSMTVAGVAVALEVFRQVDSTMRVSVQCEDGQDATAGDPILTIHGDGRSILKGERVSLNFLQRLSGIATLTARFCRAVQGSPVRILDTRKTTPGLRALEKWAVRLGGGDNHRRSLSDAAMIKDNHLVLAQSVGLGLVDCCRTVKAQGAPDLRLTVEVDSLDQVPPAIEGAPDVILLDNMAPSLVRQAVALIAGRTRVEVSGGITLDNVREYAEAGPDFISVGALTHSAPSVDLSLDFLTSSGAAPHRV